MLLLSAAVRQDPVEFIQHTYGSHAVRTLLHVLAGCVPPPRIDRRPGTQSRGPPVPPHTEHRPVLCSTVARIYVCMYVCMYGCRPETLQSLGSASSVFVFQSRGPRIEPLL